MPQLELNRLDLSPEYLVLLRQLLASHTPEAEVWAYGSRIDGSAHEGSDLDLVLRCTDNPSGEVTGYTALREALQESLLPMLVDLHLWRQLPESFRHEIERAYVVLQTEVISSNNPSASHNDIEADKRIRMEYPTGSPADGSGANP